MLNKPKIWLLSRYMGGEELDYIHQAFEKNWIPSTCPINRITDEHQKGQADSNTSTLNSRYGEVEWCFTNP